MNNLTVIYQPLSALQPYARNARIHKKEQVRQIADSITAFGFLNPILLDVDNRIMAGHGRFQAAALLGMTEVPTIRLADLSPAQRKASILADNRLAEKAGWDKDILALELGELATMKLDFEIEVTGFDLPAIDLMLQDAAEKDPDAGDEIPDPPVKPTSKLGDLWILGDHRLLCGDALEETSYQRLMDGQLAQMAWSDPPYNVAIKGNVSGLGKVQHEEFAMASGEMTQDEFTAFLAKAFGLMVAYSDPGSIHYICMDWRHMGELLAAAGGKYSELKNLCIWNKDNGGMGALYRSKHELVFVYKNGSAPHINNVELGKHGRNRANVWTYRSAHSMNRKGTRPLDMHPTVKPSRMAADALMDCSHRGGLVLDPFGGSGSTLIAAENTGRHARLVELEPKYVNVTIKRWEDLTGKDAVHAVTGKTFKQAKEEHGDE